MMAVISFTKTPKLASYFQNAGEPNSCILTSSVRHAKAATSSSNFSTISFLARGQSA